MILSPTDYRRSSKKNKVWLPVFFLLIVFIFIFSNSYAGADKFQVPVQDTIPAKRITGRVLNLEDSTPLTGASVVNLRTGHGITTTSTGIFSIEAKPGDSIRFSFAGKVAQTLAFMGQASMNVELSRSEGLLGGVVITGFQNLDRKKFTGAATQLKADDIKIPGVVDVSKMLEGRAAGVSVQNVSGTFGAAPKVHVRGATSINGENKPLWVVDGVVLEDIINISNDQLSSGDPTTLLGSAVAGLNPNDIETIDILKDAAATALYGARAMNGVVVITTKKGRSGKPIISYTGNFSTQLKPVYTDYNIMNSAQQMSVLGELERKGILTPSVLDNPDYGVYGKMYDLITVPDAYGNFALQNSTEAKAAFLKKYALANTDWFDILFKNSLTQEH